MPHIHAMQIKCMAQHTSTNQAKHVNVCDVVQTTPGLIGHNLHSKQYRFTTTALC